ncbi:EAL domain-containing protein [Pseudomonas sp. dw_358]|uniref:EAL domain-containing protein n=1 Tax=Pseudomonas sp. dw_358 TaxID=2720083 RepID=UPI001BD27EB8|nr:EAL domain-containing protein [Pseudomonas sp. dw_358]
MTRQTRVPDTSDPLADSSGSAFSEQLALERTRMLYQGSLLPTLFMLVNGLLCAWLLAAPRHYLVVSVWLVWLMALTALRVIQVAAFDSAMPHRQANPVWLRMFMLGSAASGLTLGGAAIALVPAEDFAQQAWVFGLLGAATLSASVAYAVSLPGFLSFALPCLVPPIFYSFLVIDDSHHRGWGWLGLIFLVALFVVAWQVHRLIERSLLRRFHNQQLIDHLQQAQGRSEQLNRELAEEIDHRRGVEAELREVQISLEERVAARSADLDHANRALSKSEARLALALEASALGLWDWNLLTDEVHHTQLKQLLGFEPEQSGAMLKHLAPLLHPEDLPTLKKTLLEHLRGRSESYRVEYRIRHSDGRWLWLEDRGRAVEHGPFGRVTRMLGTRRDISARKVLEEQQRLAATVFEAASEGIAVLDADYRMLAVNQAFTRVTGFSADDVIGKNVAELPSSHDARRHFLQIQRALSQQGAWQGELMETRKDGQLYPQWLQLNTVRDNQGKIWNIVAYFADLSERRESEERMRYLSHFDELTGLANRTLFRERLREAHQRVRQGGRSLALLHIDLDRFKVINAGFGHESADQVLREVARRIGSALPEAVAIARLSGDEFAVLFDAYASVSSLARVTDRLLGKLRAPHWIDDEEVVVAASVGISLLPENAREVPELLSQANMAMRQAKHLGGNTFEFFTENLRTTNVERLQLENQLRKAIEEDQLEVFYQPKLNLRLQRLDAAEALVRWRHPVRGLIGPGEFIALAEETGLINQIGEKVLRQACWQVCEWQRAGLPDVRVSVNLSVYQLRQGKLLSMVRQVLEDTGLSGRLLELELTETRLFDSVEHVISIFRQLQMLGVKMTIDDFGTGYSSLSYLKRFPVDYVKIDQAFIRGLEEGEQDAAIIQAIISMAHQLKLQVVAEGVETQAQLSFLREHGCDEVQGYLISEPISADDLSRLLASELQGERREVWH